MNEKYLLPKEKIIKIISNGKMKRYSAAYVGLTTYKEIVITNKRIIIPFLLFGISIFLGATSYYFNEKDSPNMKIPKSYYIIKKLWADEKGLNLNLKGGIMEAKLVVPMKDAKNILKKIKSSK